MVNAIPDVVGSMISTMQHNRVSHLCGRGRCPLLHVDCHYKGIARSMCKIAC